MGNKNSYKASAIPEGNGICLFGRYLPHDILRYILSYVPARDLIVSASRVCKYWCDLLSDTHFWLHKLQVDGIKRPGTACTDLVQGTDSSDALLILKMISSGYNLIKNPSGANKLSNWTIEHGSTTFKVECPPKGNKKIPDEAGLPSQHCFVPPFYPYKRQQVINLKDFRLTPVILSILKPRFIVSEWVSARPGLWSESKSVVEFIGSNSTETVELEWRSDDDGVSGDWYKVTKTVENYPADLYEIVFTHEGTRELQYWVGYYGAKTAGSSIRLTL